MNFLLMMSSTVYVANIRAIERTRELASLTITESNWKRITCPR